MEQVFSATVLQYSQDPWPQLSESCGPDGRISHDYHRPVPDIGDMVMTVNFGWQLAAQHGGQVPQLPGALSKRVIKPGVKWVQM